MTESKPTPEALAVALASDPNKYAPSQHIPFALALDACIEAALKRRNDLLAHQAALSAARAFEPILRASCEEAVKQRDRLAEELEATRKELARMTAARDEWRHSNGVALTELAELESLRKPLEGELAGDLELLRESISDWVEGEDSYDRSHAALDRIEAALRAKGAQEQGHQGCPCESCRTLGELSAEGLVALVDQQVTSEAIDTVKTRDAQRWLRAKGEPQAAEPPGCPECSGSCVGGCLNTKAAPPEPRPIVVLSKWKAVGDPESGEHTVEKIYRGKVTVRVPDGECWLFEKYDLPVRTFRANFIHVSDPEPAAPAPELASKVEPGTTLTAGARYRITAISADDNCPCDQVGDVVTGYTDSQKMPVGTVFVNWDSDGYWFAKGSGPSGGTYVTGLELAADAPKESK